MRQSRWVMSTIEVFGLFACACLARGSFHLGGQGYLAWVASVAIMLLGYVEGHDAGYRDAGEVE